MAKFSDVTWLNVRALLRQELVLIHVNSHERWSFWLNQKPLMVERRDQSATVGLFAKAVEAEGIETLEDIAFLAVLWRTAMPLDKALYSLEAGD